MGRTTTVTDKRNNTTTYVYNGLGERERLISPDAGATTYNNYDGAGNVLVQTDARNITQTATYDSLNRMKSVTTSDGSSTIYDYDINPSSSLSCINTGNLSRIT